LEVHAAGEADANLYAYVSGPALKAVDPVGLDYTAVVENGKIHIVVPIHVYGADAAKTAAAIKKDFEAHWKTRSVTVGDGKKITVSF